MKKLAIFCALLMGVVSGAESAVPQQRRGQSGDNTGATATTTATSRTGAVTARSATSARSATTRTVQPAQNVTARAATTGRTTVNRGATTTNTGTSATRVSARAGATQRVINTGTTIAAANENVVVSQACRDKYYGCMDSFCMLDNDSGGRCICSDRNAELDDILAQIEELDQQSYQMATYGVERIEMGDAADVAIANANAVAQSILEEAEEQNQTPLDLTSWMAPVDFAAEDIFADTGIMASPIEGKEGDALYQASHSICVEQMPECADELSMLQLMYAQQIRSDCSAYENSLKQQKNASAQKLYVAEQALRDAALEQYQTANKYDLGQCTVEFRNCMITTGGCGEDFSGCASVAAFDSTNTRGRGADADTYEIQGAVTSIEIKASTYDILLSKKPLCDTVTRQCQAVADQVWDTFLRDVAPQVKSAELIAEDNVRQNCIGNISSCFQQACLDTMDPNDPEGSYDLCLTRPGTMLNLCQVPLNACGVSTVSETAAEGSDIWDFVLARLGSMRVNSCSSQFKECLQSEDRCGEDYTQCIGLDTDTIVRMCPYDTLVGCQEIYGDTEIRDDDVYEQLYSIAQGVFLNIDNNMLTECQNAADEAMIAVCGDSETCTNLTVDENIGARSLEYKICEYTNYDNSLQIDYGRCRMDVSQILDTELGRVEGSLSTQLGPVTPFAGVIDGLIYWENVEIDENGRLTSVDDYLEKIGETDISEEDRDKLSSELAVLQKNIDTAIAAIEADPQVQYCMTGREVQGIQNVDRAGNVVDRSGITGRFPALTKQMRMIIATAALKQAKDNYYKKYDELMERMMQDYATIGERIAENQGENALDVRREYARVACINFAEMASLPKSPNPPGNWFGKVLGIGALAVATVFTGGAAMAAVGAATVAGTVGAAVAGAGIAAAGGLMAAEGLKSSSANGEDASMQRELIGSKQLNQWNYKEVVTATFEWEPLVCHKCVRSQQCGKTKNPLFGRKYCKRWNDPVETCEDIQF